jgi:2-phospho-L-lactate guanylyltransferase
LERDIWAVLPIKDLTQAKQRLSPRYSPGIRQGLAIAMAEDVLGALCGATGLGGVLVVTDDPIAIRLAARFGCRISSSEARSGHTAAVAGAARLLTAEGRSGMLVVPGDIPLVTAGEISTLLRAHATSQGFSIVPAHDERGSNAIVCSPPDRVPLSYGNDSYFPHLATARALGIEPQICHLPRIGLDIDHPNDLALFMKTPSLTKAYAYLQAHAPDAAVPAEAAEQLS